MRGFYTFEGIDGSGKSSVMSRVAGRLSDDGLDVHVTQEPTTTWLGEAVERSYGEDVSPFTEAYLFMADRATHSREISRHLAEGRMVLSDRYAHSTIAYQGAALADHFGGAEAAMRFLEEGHRPFVLEPERVFLFDIEPRIGLERVTKRGELSKFEKAEYLGRVRANYLKLAEWNGNFVVIDASQPLDAVLDGVMKMFK